MSSGLAAIQMTGVKSGSCPHGLPSSACPICSGGMGGGSKKVATADFSAKSGEMSWNECAAIGAFLKSLQNTRLARVADSQNQIIAMAQFENNMAKLANSLQTFIQTRGQNALMKPVVFIAQNVLLPIVNFMKTLPTTLLEVTANIAQKLADISDKLTAIYGELKAAINKKISDFSKKIKKKLMSIFEIFHTENEGSDDERIMDYEKQINKLKSYLEKIIEKPTIYKEKYCGN